MITSVTLENFRCFLQRTIFDLRPITLFGGSNNKGKTALLEGFYLGSCPRPDTILSLRRLRRESSESLQMFPAQAWDNFFYQQDKQQWVKIVIEQSGEESSSVLLACDRTDIFDEEDGDIQWPKNSTAQSTLYLGRRDKGGWKPTSYLIAHPAGLTIKEIAPPSTQEVLFLPALFRASPISRLRDYHRTELSSTESSQLLGALQQIDSSLEAVKMMTVGQQPTLYVKQKESSWLPVSLFGKAVNRVVDINLGLINGYRLLIIDEIDNGIHYTRQRHLWQLLFDLALEFKAQIFASTYSREMAESFQMISQEPNYKEMGRYLELDK